MKSKQPNEQSLVRRITVDERLAEDIIRVLISRLPKGVREFRIEKAQWEDEEEHFVEPDTYLADMGIPTSEAEKWSWADFREGQVFLSGRFKIIGKGESPENLLVGQGRNEFLLIEGLVRKNTEKLYFRALERRK
jgi:hypothetical protein